MIFSTAAMNAAFSRENTSAADLHRKTTRTQLQSANQVTVGNNNRCKKILLSKMISNAKRREHWPMVTSLKGKATKFKLQNLQPVHSSLFRVEPSNLKRVSRLVMFCNRLKDWIKIKYFILKSSSKDLDFKVQTDLRQVEVILDSKTYRVLNVSSQLSQQLNICNNRKTNSKELWILSHKLYTVFLQAMGWEQELPLLNKIFLNPPIKIKLQLVFRLNNPKTIIKMSIWMLTLWKLVLLVLYKGELGLELLLWLSKVISFDRYHSRWLV